MLLFLTLSLDEHVNGIKQYFRYVRTTLAFIVGTIWILRTEVLHMQKRFLKILPQFFHICDYMYFLKGPRTSITSSQSFSPQKCWCWLQIVIIKNKVHEFKKCSTFSVTFSGDWAERGRAVKALNSGAQGSGFETNSCRLVLRVPGQDTLL